MDSSKDCQRPQYLNNTLNMSLVGLKIRPKQQTGANVIVYGLFPVFYGTQSSLEENLRFTGKSTDIYIFFS